MTYVPSCDPLTGLFAVGFGAVFISSQWGPINFESIDANSYEEKTDVVMKALFKKSFVIDNIYSPPIIQLA